MHATTFRNGQVELAAHLHVPDDFDAGGSYAALVLATPGSRVKEQVGAVYARKLAARGLVALTFDPACQGDSGGEPRDLEDPARRIEDLRCAVDHLTTLPFVDATRIGLLGLCTGGGDAVGAALTERRFNAVATVAGNDIGRAFRRLPERLAQPLMVIVGGRPGSTGQYEDGQALYARAGGPDKAFVEIEDAGHHDLTHRDVHVDQAIDRLAPFFHFHLEA